MLMPGAFEGEGLAKAAQAMSPFDNSSATGCTVPCETRDECLTIVTRTRDAGCLSGLHRQFAFLGSG